MPNLIPNFIKKKKDGKSIKPSPGKPKLKSEGGHSVSLSCLFLFVSASVVVLGKDIRLPLLASAVLVPGFFITY